MENSLDFEQMMYKAQRDVHKAQKAYDLNYNRSGVTEQERENLADNVAYAHLVLELVSSHVNSIRE